MYRAIMVDDEPWTLIDMEQLFASEAVTNNFTIIGSFRSPQKAFPVILQEKPDLIITDIRMPGMSGIDLMKQVRAQGQECEFIVVSGYGDFEYAREALGYGACGYCLKPLNPDEAKKCLERVIKRLDAKHADTSKKDIPLQLHQFEQMLNYIQVHFSEKLTLKVLAGTYHMNPNYCCTLFLKNTGKTFSQYLTHIRMEEAKKLLCEMILPLEKIATLVGFSDYFYFSKVFKKECGFSPKEYRKKRGTT